MVLYAQFDALCRDLDFYGRELIAVDGTRIKAVNSKDRNFTKASLDKLIAQSDERLEKYLSQLDTGDGDEQRATGSSQTRNLEDKIANIRARRDQLRGYQAELKASGEDQISLTDPNARAMARMTKVGVGYNIQIAVDAKHSLIAEQHVTNKVLDYGHLTETAKAAKEILKAETPDVVADRGYFQVEDIEACIKAGMTPYVPKPDRGPAKRDGLFPKEAFTFDAENDRYKCPGEKFLRLRGTGELREGSNGAPIPDTMYVPDARCALNARSPNSASLHAMAMKPSLSAWQSVSPHGPSCKTFAAKRLNTPSAPSNNG